MDPQGVAAVGVNTSLAPRFAEEPVEWTPRRSIYRRTRMETFIGYLLVKGGETESICSGRLGDISRTYGCIDTDADIAVDEIAR